MNIPINRFEEWLVNKNLKERTIENYLYYFNKFNFDVFTQETVSKFLSKKANRNTNARGFLANFQKYLKVNHRELGINDIVLGKIIEVELPKLTGRTKKRIIKPIPHEQIELLERYLDNEKEKIQLLLTYYCGLRLGELLKIKIISFNWNEWKQDITKYGECRVFGKGDKEGIALVPPFLMQRIAKFIKTRKYNSLDSRLFIPDNKEITAQYIKNRGRSWQQKLNNAGILSGITKKSDSGAFIEETRVFPHRLRHSYAHYLLKVKKMNLREVQELLRHSSIQSTQVYTYIDKENLKEKLKN